MVNWLLQLTHAPQANSDYGTKNTAALYQNEKGKESYQNSENNLVGIGFIA